MPPVGLNQDPIPDPEVGGLLADQYNPADGLVTWNGWLGTGAVAGDLGEFIRREPARETDLPRMLVEGVQQLCI